MTFLLDPRLESDSFFVIPLTLCQVRLHKNAAFPWLLLIPQQNGLREIIDLSPGDQGLLMEEISLASQVMKTLFYPHKLNVANLGNSVAQLHIHIISRQETDRAWPHPVWNSGVSESYTSQQEMERIRILTETFEAALSKKDNMHDFF